MELLFEDSYIRADNIIIGEDFSIGKNVHIDVRGTFKIGDRGRFGDDVTINAQQVYIGHDFFHYTPGLEVGGGGSQFPEAVLSVGNRCVFHNNYINLAREVIIGHDVGLSPDVDIITHGFWKSILAGYPVKYEGVFIGNGVIVGQRSLILPGVNIAADSVIGAGSVVAKSLEERHSIYAGNPAKFIRRIKTIDSEEERESIANSIIDRYLRFGKPQFIDYNYPNVGINDAVINLETERITGTEDDDTDKFRDFLRRYGIRIYTKRPFKSL